ncbi:MAG: hypothetical protein K8J08_14135, partial [Thermoanaerobaculia bacterium]|nr:hypothetical protein [Thermoanaerobaculia bacterium]
MSGEGVRRPALLGLSRQQLTEVLGSTIDRPFRVEQIFRALHEGGCGDFADMTNLSHELRSTLASQFDTGALEVSERHEARDGTTKYLFELHDGATIEAVDIPDSDRRTYCISSQAGCALACR